MLFYRTLLSALLAFMFVSATEPAAPRSEIRGVSVAHAWGRGEGGYGSPACFKQFQSLSTLGANWVSLSNFAWMTDITQPDLRFATDRTLGEGNTGKAIDDAHAAGLKVFLKPHIWARQFGSGGKWHGDIAMTSEADWDTFFDNYTRYLLACAKVAEETKTEMFCIGVEYVGATKGPALTARWRKLITAVRAVYTGKLTYSAAFLEWRDVQFWDALDAIAISAYFPLTDLDSAPEVDIRSGWERVYTDLEALHKRTGKPILFSELGYTVSPKAGREPWSYDVDKADEAFQARLFKVALEEAASRPFVQGVFLWKWYSAPMTGIKRAREEPFLIETRPQAVEAIGSVWKPK